MLFINHLSYQSRDILLKHGHFNERCFKFLEQFPQPFLHSILNIKWSSSVGTTLIKAMILTNQRRWCGHIFKMADKHKDQQLFHGEIIEWGAIGVNLKVDLWMT